MESNLKMKRRSLGMKHPEYAATLSNIGTIYMNMGQYEEALKIYEECLSLQELILGEDHPDCTVTLNNIENIYLKSELGMVVMIFTKKFDELSN